MNKVKISEVATMIRGVSYKKEQSSKTAKEGYSIILRANNISNGELNFDDLVYVQSPLIHPDQFINAGDIIITMSSGSKAHVGKVAIAHKKLAAAHGAFCAKIVSTGISSEYLYYLLRSSNFRKHIEHESKGTNINNLKQDYILNYSIPLPSDAEQKRIVKRIEELLSQLNEGIEILNITQKQLDVYKEAVLEQAFSGKLTHSNMGGMKCLRDLIEPPRYGTSKKCSYDYQEGGKAVYRIPNIDHKVGRIDRQDIKYANFSNQELSGIQLEVGDILIIRSNGSESLVGRAALVYPENTSATFAGYLMRLRIKDKENFLPKYLLYYLGSHSARVYIEGKAKSTSGVNNINSDEISELQVPYYSKEDQLSIIEAIESRLSVCDNIQESVNYGIKRADVMRQSILQKAIEGRL